MINCYHSDIFNDFFEINPHARSDFILNNLNIEIKEASVRKNAKNSNNCYLRFTIKRKDIKAHDFFIFHDIDLHDFYLLNAKTIDDKFAKSNFKVATRVSLEFVKHAAIIITSDLTEIKKYLESI